MRGRRTLGLVVIAALVAAAVPLAAAVAEEPPCEWLAGDFHVHTVYSHDAYGGPEDEGTGADDFYTFGWTPGQQGAIAESRDLDFIAITDHDNVDGYLRRDQAASGFGLYESGWGRQSQLPGGDPLVWVPNYENSVSGAGHVGMHGAAKVYDRSLQAPEVAAAIRADGGAFQINHPADTDWHTYTNDKDGDGVQDYDEFTYDFPELIPDALEVWNIGAWFYEPPFPATNDHEFPLKMYDDFLDQGSHVAATGGSDNHWRSTTAVQGVGQPATWVCASERSSQGIIDGILRSRTTISHQPPAYMGARAFLNADGDGDGTFESMLGDMVDPGSQIQAVVENAEGATLRLVTNGGATLAEDTISSINFSKAYEVPEDSTWIRAEVFYPDGSDSRAELMPLCDVSNELFGSEPDSRNTYCENRLAVVALTSPIYFEAPDFDPTTTLTYDGDTRARVGSTITLAATLLDSTGAPLAEQPIAFSFRGSSYSATTDDNGRAAVSGVKLTGPPGSYDVISSYLGSETYSPSQDQDPISVTASNGKPK
jgi:hypothetical protein